MLEKILEWINSDKKLKNIGDNESFILLLKAAKDDKEFLKRILLVLKMNEFNRISTINSMIEKMKLNNVSINIINAIASLLDNKVAKEALEVIENKK